MPSHSFFFFLLAFGFALRVSSPSSCAAAGERCGGYIWYHGPKTCCNARLLCAWKHKYYAQCLESCPAGQGWQCEANDDGGEVRQPSPSEKLPRSCNNQQRMSHVCLFTHSDPDRFLATAPRLSRSWPGEISWAILLRTESLVEAAPLYSPESLRARGVCSAPGLLKVTLLQGADTFYPPHKSRCEFPYRGGRVLRLPLGQR